MIFIAVATLLGLVAAAAVAVPLWRGAKVTANDAAGTTHAVELEDLERDLATGALSQDDYAAARHDLEAERPTAAGVSPAAQPGRRVSAIAAAVLVLGTGTALYWYFGNWRVGVQGIDAASQASVVQMVAELDARLHGADAGDLQGWEMLGHAYVLMERYPQALDAYSHARKLSGDTDATVLAGYAESMTLADPDSFMDKALPVFEKALALDPRNPQALWYGGLGAMQRGDNKLAVARWQSLLDQDPPAQYRAVIEKAMREAGGTPAAAPAPAAIQLHVSLAAALLRYTTPYETVYVFALPAGDSVAGPPLAVKRLQVRDLPADVTLTDQDAVMAGRSLSAYGELKVMARVSKSGRPEAGPGDLTGQGSWSKQAAKPVSIVVDTPLK